MKVSAKNLFRFMNAIVLGRLLPRNAALYVSAAHRPKQVAVLIFGALVMMMTAGSAHARTLLTYNDLMTGTYPAPVDYSAYLPDATATTPPYNTFEGRLRISGGTVSNFLQNWEPAIVPAAVLPSIKSFPDNFDFEFVQDGDKLIPVQRGPIPSLHLWWEFVLETGKVWNEASDYAYSRAAIPFSFKQAGADCVHNGVIMFLFKNDGTTSRAAFQIVSETCPYLAIDLWGLQDTAYSRGAVADKIFAVIEDRLETASRLPTAPISQLATKFPGVNPSKFSMSIPDKTAVYGVVAKGVNYVGGCKTRYGTYPYCDVLDLPSYSLAKSIFGSLAFMHLSTVFPNLKDELVTDWIPECKTPAWSGVKVADLLNMATGNYDSKLYLADEEYWFKTKGLFVPYDHPTKLKYSCEAYLRKATPGTTWVYHTSDYYILGTILNKVAKSKTGSDLGEVMQNIFRNLGLSQTIRYTRRTYDAARQPLTGWGLTLHHDDIARIAKFIGSQHGNVGISQKLHPDWLDIAMQQNPAARGLYVPVPGFDNYKYSLGFWASNLKGFTCTGDFWLPQMYGTTGINVLLFPDDAVYYSFAYDQNFDWTDPAIEMKKVTPYCK